MKKYLAPLSLALCPYGFLLLALIPDAWIENLPMAVFFGLLALQLVTSCTISALSLKLRR